MMKGIRGWSIYVIAVVLVILAAILILVFTGVIEGLEAGVSSLRNPKLTFIMIGIAQIGSTMFLVVLAIMLLTFPFTRQRLGYPVAIAGIISAIVNLTLKLVFQRQRPDEALRLVSVGGYAFPSGHAQSTTAIFLVILLCTLALVNNKQVKACLAVAIISICFLVGLSRIYLGVHYASDVFVGWMIGISIAYLVSMLWQTKSKKGQRENLQPLNHSTKIEIK